MKVKSVKQEPILKQFYVYFFVASVIPFFVLIYIIFQSVTFKNIDISNIGFIFLMIIVGALSILGLLGTRSFLIRIARLSNKLREQTLDKLDRNAILELAKGEGEVAQLAKVFSEITTNLEASVRELEETKRMLYQVLSKVGKAVGSAENFDLLIKFILETIVEALGAKRGVIYFLDEENKVLRNKAVVGVDDKFVPPAVKVGDEALGWVVKEKKTLFVPLLEEREEEFLFSSPLIAAPLIVHDKVWGAIALSGKKTIKNFSEDDLKILSNLAYQIAVSFENAALSKEAERTYFETISALALAVEAKDPYSRGHSERVAKYAIKIAECLGLSGEDLSTLRDAARLHDIGKIGITDEILQKSDKLTMEEIMIMNKHTQIGEGIVKPLRSFRHIINPIKHHHEFLDGSGYPDGLKAEEIPLVTRVLTVADIFDALISDRPYRKAFSIDEAKNKLEGMVQLGKIDRDVVNALLKLIEEKKI